MKIVCDVLGVARSNVHVRVHRPANWTDRRRNRRARDDVEPVAEITHEIAGLPSYGYRCAWALVNRRRHGEGRRRVNHKRVYRVMRDCQLLLRRHTGRPIDTCSHDGRIAVSESNRRWCSDGFEIACDNRERVRVAFALDCCDREAMSWISTTGSRISGDMVRDLMMEAVETRFNGTAPTQPIEWLTDNGSPYIARDTRSFAREIGLEPLTTAIRSPQSNGMAEAFVKTFKAGLRRAHGSLGCGDGHAAAQCGVRTLQRRSSAQRTQNAVASHVQAAQRPIKCYSVSGEIGATPADRARIAALRGVALVWRAPLPRMMRRLNRHGEQQR
jgi:putative transposase